MPFSKVIVKDHSTFGRDEELGETQFTIDDQGSGSEKNVGVGKGMVVIRSSFQPAEAASVMDGGASPKPGKGRNLLSRGRDRSATPA